MSCTVQIKSRNTVKMKKTNNVIHRTTSETLRLSEPEALTNNTSRQVLSAISPPILKKSSCSFQITGVSVTQRSDLGDDSADDLDESHTDDISRVTDNETPSFSEDTCSRDTEDNIVESCSALCSVTVIPTATDFEIKNILSSETSLITTAEFSETSINHLAFVDDMADPPPVTTKNQRFPGTRFTVVKIETGIPVRRGRWECLDYIDNSVYTPKHALTYNSTTTTDLSSTNTQPQYTMTPTTPTKPMQSDIAALGTNYPDSISKLLQPVSTSIPGVTNVITGSPIRPAILPGTTTSQFSMGSPLSNLQLSPMSSPTNQDYAVNLNNLPAQMLITTNSQLSTSPMVNPISNPTSAYSLPASAQPAYINQSQVSAIFTQPNMHSQASLYSSSLPGSTYSLQSQVSATSALIQGQIQNAMQSQSVVYSPATGSVPTTYIQPTAYINQGQAQQMVTSQTKQVSEFVSQPTISTHSLYSSPTQVAVTVSLPTFSANQSLGTPVQQVSPYSSATQSPVPIAGYSPQSPIVTTTSQPLPVNRNLQSQFSTPTKGVVSPAQNQSPSPLVYSPVQNPAQPQTVQQNLQPAAYASQSSMPAQHNVQPQYLTPTKVSTPSGQGQSPSGYSPIQYSVQPQSMKTQPTVYTSTQSSVPVSGYSSQPASQYIQGPVQNLSYSSSTPVCQILSNPVQRSISTYSQQPQTATYSPQSQTATNSPQPQAATNSPQPQTATYSPQPQTATYSPQPQTATHSPQSQAATYSPQPQAATYSPQPQAATYSPQPQGAIYSAQPQAATYSPQPQAATYSPQPQAAATYSSQPQAAATYSSQPQAAATYSPQPQSATYSPQPQSATYSPLPQAATYSPQPHTATQSIQPKVYVQSSQPQVYSTQPQTSQYYSQSQVTPQSRAIPQSPITGYPLRAQPITCSPQPQISGYSTQSQATTYSPQPQVSVYSSQSQGTTTYSPQPQASGHSSQSQASAYSPQPQASGYSTQSQATGYSPQPQVSGYSSQPQATTYSPQPQASGYSSQSQATAYSPQAQASGYSSQSQATNYSPQPQVSTYSVQPQVSASSSQSVPQKLNTSSKQPEEPVDYIAQARQIIMDMQRQAQIHLANVQANSQSGTVVSQPQVQTSIPISQTTTYNTQHQVQAPIPAAGQTYSNVQSQVQTSPQSCVAPQRQLSAPAQLSSQGSTYVPQQVASSTNLLSQPQVPSRTPSLVSLPQTQACLGRLSFQTTTCSHFARSLSQDQPALIYQTASITTAVINISQPSTVYQAASSTKAGTTISQSSTGKQIASKTRAGTYISQSPASIQDQVPPQDQKQEGQSIASIQGSTHGSGLNVPTHLRNYSTTVGNVLQDSCSVIQLQKQGQPASYVALPQEHGSYVLHHIPSLSLPLIRKPHLGHPTRLETQTTIQSYIPQVDKPALPLKSIVHHHVPGPNHDLIHRLPYSIHNVIKRNLVGQTLSFSLDPKGETTEPESRSYVYALHNPGIAATCSKKKLAKLPPRPPKKTESTSTTAAIAKPIPVTSVSLPRVYYEEINAEKLFIEKLTAPIFEKQKEQEAAARKKQKQLEEQEATTHKKQKQLEEQEAAAHKKQLEEQEAAARKKQKQLEEQEAAARKKQKLLKEQLAAARKKQKQLEEQEAVALKKQKQLEEQEAAAHKKQKQLDDTESDDTEVILEIAMAQPNVRVASMEMEEIDSSAWVV